MEMDMQGCADMRQGPAEGLRVPMVRVLAHPKGSESERTFQVRLPREARSSLGVVPA